ncbi:hypothetical protein SLS64_007923 [Diaporthe eres]
MDQAVPDGRASTSGFDSLGPEGAFRSKAWKNPSDDNRAKRFGTTPGPGAGDHNHTMAFEPKRSPSKKIGGHLPHDKPSQKSETLQYKVKPGHTPKHPQTASGGNSRPSGYVAAGVLAGVAVGATVISVAGTTGVGEDPDSDSENMTHAGAYGNYDDGTGSESGNDAQDTDQGHDSSNHSSVADPDELDDLNNFPDEIDGDGEDEDNSDGSESDIHDDQDAGLSSPDLSDTGGPEDFDDLDGDDASNEDEDGHEGVDDASLLSGSSDEEADKEEDESENSQSEDEGSGSESESENSDSDAISQEASGQEDNIDEEADDSLSEGEENESGQETDNEEAEQDLLSSDGSNGSSDHGVNEDSDDYDFSDEDE